MTVGSCGPVETQVRADVAALGPLTGVHRSVAEIAYVLARELDSGELAAPTPVARELAGRLADLAQAAGGKVSRVDELAARRTAHVAATAAAPGT